MLSCIIQHTAFGMYEAMAEIYVALSTDNELDWESLQAFSIRGALQFR